MNVNTQQNLHQSQDDFLPENCSEKNPENDNNKDDLIYSKLFYFCYSSAMGSLWPYFPLYFRQQFLTPRQVGAIVASRTLVQFLCVPFWCAIAEKFRKHKELLLVGLFAWLISTLCILAVPREEPKACLEMNKDVNTKHSKVWFDFTPLIEPSSLSSYAEKVVEPTVNSVKPSRNVKSFKDSRYISKQGNSVKSIKNVENVKNDRYKREQEGIYDDYYSPATMFNTSTDLATIFAEYDPARHITDTSRPFILLLLITIFGVSLASPAQTLVDICTMKKLRCEEQSFGKQVVWAAIGSASFAFITGTFVSFFKSRNPCTNQPDINYSPCFYMFAFFMIITILVSTQFSFDTKNQTNNTSTRIDLDESIANLWECVKTVNDIHLASLLVVAFYCGFGNGFISTFLFWHLREMGGLQILLALVSLINSTAEVVFYIMSEQLMGLIGHFRLIYIGLFCFSARFFYYSFLRQPWLVLPIEITHGMTSAAIRSAIISYIRQEGAAGHLLHGLFNGIHGGLGFSIGGLVGGLMVHSYGHTITFLIFGELSLLTLFCFILVNNIWPQTKHDLKETYIKPLKMHTTNKAKKTDFKIFANESVDHSFRNLSAILSNTGNDRSLDLG